MLNFTALGQTVVFDVEEQLEGISRKEELAITASRRDVMNGPGI